MKLNITKNFNLSKKEIFDLSRPLNVGIDYIAADIERGIENGANMGKAFKDNAESTIKKKGFNHPLLENGSMKDSSRMVKTKATYERQVASLRPNEDNINKVEWNNFGTKTIPAREFWGISKNAEKQVLTFTSQHLDRVLRNA